MHPIFESYTVDELARRTGYSEYYILQVRDGTKPLTKPFRRLCAAVFQRPEAELFLSEEALEAARDGAA